MSIQLGEEHFIAHPDYNEDTYLFTEEEISARKKQGNDDEEYVLPIVGQDLIDLIADCTDENGNVDTEAALAIFCKDYAYKDENGNHDPITLEWREWRGVMCWHFVEHISAEENMVFGLFNPDTGEFVKMDIEDDTE